MSARLLTLALVALGFAACSSNDPEDVVLTSKEMLVERYSSLAPGTFRVKHPSERIEFQGTDMRPGLVEPGLSLFSSDGEYVFRVTSDVLVKVDSLGEVGWSGTYNGSEGPHSCSGRLYVLESTASLLRAVFAGSCGVVGPLSGPSHFQLLEGGFAYVR